MTFKIESNIPLPERNGKKNTKYPFGTMNAGESVFIKGAKPGGKEYSAAHNTGRRKGWVFRTQAQDGGLRIWRVE